VIFNTDNSFIQIKHTLLGVRVNFKVGDGVMVRVRVCFGSGLWLGVGLELRYKLG